MVCFIIVTEGNNNTKLSVHFENCWNSSKTTHNSAATSWCGDCVNIGSNYWNLRCTILIFYTAIKQPRALYSDRSIIQYYVTNELMTVCVYNSQFIYTH